MGPFALSKGTLRATFFHPIRLAQRHILGRSGFMGPHHGIGWRVPLCRLFIGCSLALLCLHVLNLFPGPGRSLVDHLMWPVPLLARACVIPFLALSIPTLPVLMLLCA